MAWKYIMFNNVLPGGAEFLLPVIFPDKLVHRDVALGLRKIMPGWQHAAVFAYSAGMIEHVAAHGVGGGSTTLGVRSMNTDARTIAMFSYAHGIR